MDSQTNIIEDRNIIIMQESHDLFIASLVLLLDIIKKDPSSQQLQTEILDKTIDSEKKGNIIKKVFMLLDKYYDFLNSNDVKLFNLIINRDKGIAKVAVIPGINLGSLWKKIDENGKSKIWVYLKYMYIASSDMIGASNDNNDVTSENKIKTIRDSLKISTKTIFDDFLSKFPNSTAIDKKEFNAFIGVGSNISNYGVEDLLKSAKVETEQSNNTASGIGMGNIANMIGLDKMVNLEEISKQLKNITKEQIDEATKNIKSLLGDIDGQTSEMIDLMLTEMTNELKKDDVGEGNPVSNLMKIAENVAQKMVPKMGEKKIDMNKLWDTTKNIAAKCNDKNGKPLFDGPNNPLSLVTGLMEKQMQSMKDPSKKKMSQDEYLKECQGIMKDLGMPNISKDQLKNLNMNDLFNTMSSASNQQNVKVNNSQQSKNKKHK